VAGLEEAPFGVREVGLALVAGMFFRRLGALLNGFLDRLIFRKEAKRPRLREFELFHGDLGIASVTLSQPSLRSAAEK